MFDSKGGCCGIYAVPGFAKSNFCRTGDGMKPVPADHYYRVAQVKHMIVKKCGMLPNSASAQIYDAIKRGVIKIMPRRSGYPIEIEAAEAERYVNDFREVPPNAGMSVASPTQQPGTNTGEDLRCVVLHALSVYLRSVPKEQREDESLNLCLECTTAALATVAE
jgi:hypothetical protein